MRNKAFFQRLRGKIAESGAGGASPGGFTLIELLIVVAIIAILAAIAIPNFLEAQTRSKVSRVQADHRTMALALTAYMTDMHKTPPQATVGTSLADRLSQREALNKLSTPISYIASIPPDPFSREDNPILARPYYVNLTQISGLNPTGMGINKFIVGSVGPDQKQELDRMMLDLTYWSWVEYNGVYDPTNGSVSAGDVARTACDSIGGHGH